jgi:hypothetical protein
MPSIDVETKEEKQVVDSKSLGKEKRQKDKSVVYLIDWIPSIGRNPLYL